MNGTTSNQKCLDCNDRGIDRRSTGLCHRCSHYRWAHGGSPRPPGADHRKLGSRKTHGLSRTKIYQLWAAMIQRCTNPNRQCFRYYGGLGVTVCERWMTFENFHADMGEKPDGMSLDRIDTNGPYEPGNCRWADYVTQATNQRKKKLRKTDEKECRNCKSMVAEYMRRGLCHACDEYARRCGVDRPRSKEEIARLAKAKVYTASFRRSYAVEMLDREGNVIRVFPRLQDATAIYGNGVGNVLSGRSKTCGGFYWRKAEHRNTRLITDSEWEELQQRMPYPP
jgi:hypothetical protein